MSLFPLKPTHKPIKAYYEALAQFHKHGHVTEGNTKAAFAALLRKCCSPYGWHLVEEYPFKGPNKQPLRADGALVDDLTVQHGFWEAKDTNDDLKKEIKAKFAKGYPRDENILFQSPDCAVLYQGGLIAFDKSIDTPENLVEVLELFFEYRRPHEVDWEESVIKFSARIPELANGVKQILADEYKKNPTFRENFESFADLCRQSINPDLSDDAIRNMLVQHLLTERIFRKVFDNQEFLRRNVIAAEIEKVIQSITARHFSRDAFLKNLDHFYTAIEKAAETQTGYTEKQHFLNAVYEKFFQSFDTKQADTMGIVYTPQPIVDFMVRSVEEILQQEFGKTLSDKGVHILDPFTGTGNFITRIMQQIKRSALPQKYSEELHCNEIMLLPYYIASMNIEHAFMEKIGEYKPFEGICLVDTFELSEFGQQSFAFSDSNTARVVRQKKAPIFVVIGNPPYNVGQDNENDQNKNRRYKHWENRIKDTYTKDSKATLRNKLSDPYVKAFRWASDRIRNGGIIAYVTNNSYIDQIAFDGMRHHLARDFSKLYILDLNGNVRQNPRLSGTTHNVFGIQVGVSISLLIKLPNHKGKGKIFHAEMPGDWKRGQKYNQLDSWKTAAGLKWKTLKPDARNNWLTAGEQKDFAELMPLRSLAPEALFDTSSLGVSTNRDEWAYGFSKYAIKENVSKFIENLQIERARYAAGRDKKKFAINADGTFLKWSETLIRKLKSNQPIGHFQPKKIQKAMYRPFCQTYIYLDSLLIDRPSQQRLIFPAVQPEMSNKTIWLKTGTEVAFWGLATNAAHDLMPQGGSQSFPFFLYDEDGTNRRENITDWALAEFRTHYADKRINKWDIFHAIYAVLHHPEYRTRYAANLKRELPRIPFPPDFHTFAAAGKRLMELHIDYEKQPEYKLEQLEDPKAEVTFRVERMKLSKDKTELTYNDFLKLRGIPAAAFDYRLGNRSALEWVIDQYRVSTDARSGIVNDPNREDDPQYILRLIGQVITVSLETQTIIGGLPPLNFVV
ncbi:MAG TPA: type ISP restriction/modification enzyme [Acidobacteriaceae bacterium]